ncbi:acyltransferase family protein [Ruminococcus flavefaciens]|uniref:acyltransferase family protein n=1 Tax=Ruminococcus flavefaciens TaxID=1265 RepID=UPI001A9A43FB|nr:acyltransferase family protein [Ruminococcus flavefaciens]
MAQQTDRAYFNVLKGVLIILVVIGHFLQIITQYPAELHAPEFETLIRVSEGIVLFIYSFHMPLFVFVSGYFSKNLLKRRNKAFAELLISYLLIQFMFGCLELILHRDSSAFTNLFYPHFGLWYLLALFLWRMLLPNLVKVRGIVWIALVLNIISGVFLGFDNTMAIQRTVAFLIYFLIGYYTDDVYLKKVRTLLPKWLARILLLVGAILMISGNLYLKKYSLFLNIFVHSRVSISLKTFYLEVLMYSFAFVVAVIMGGLVLNALPEKNSLIERVGVDTMPLYALHLFVYTVLLAVSSHCEEVVAIVIMIIGTLFSILLFSTALCRKIWKMCFVKAGQLIFKV